MEANAWTKSVPLSHPNAMQYGMLVLIKEYSTWPTTYSDVSAAKNMVARNDALITASTGNIFNTEQVMQIIFPLFFLAHICLHFEVNMIFGFSAPLNISVLVGEEKVKMQFVKPKLPEEQTELTERRRND